MPLNSSELESLYNSLDESYRNASARVGEQAHYFTVAGSGLKFQFAGTALVPLLIPAFEHLPVGEPVAGSAVLKLAFWDSESTGLPLPVTLPAISDEETCYYISDNIKLAVSSGGNLCVILNQARGEGVFWIRSAASIPGFERAAPARVLLHWWFAAQGAQLVHAAAVALDGEAVLLAGKSGSGKSTTSLNCMQAGFEFLGDDYCLMTMETPLSVHSLFGSAKLYPDNLDERLPALTREVVNQTELDSSSYDKAVVYPARRMVGPMGTSRPIKAILLPEVSGREVTSLDQVSSMQALKALAPSSLLQMPGLNQQALTDLARLVRSCPCYRLALGSDMNAVPAAVRTLWN